MRPLPILIASAFCSLLLIFTLPIYQAHAQTFVQYKVQIEGDGSAIWTIIQASTLNGTIDTWQTFQQRTENLVVSAGAQTQRQMKTDPNSLQMNTVWENQSQTTEYQFTWLNFSIVQNEQIVIGDVFTVNGFFSKLYGDGELQMSCPPTYEVQSASPQPNGINTSPQTLDYLGTQFFVDGNPNITLTPAQTTTPSPDQANNNTDWQLYAAMGVSAFAIAASIASLFLARRRSQRRKEGAKSELAATSLLIETEEEKVAKAIRANGGSAYQSAITEQLRFSKAKTSQLLTALEKKGVVRRYKKGRDKIVTLTEKGKSDSP